MLYASHKSKVMNIKQTLIDMLDYDESLLGDQEQDILDKSSKGQDDQKND